MALILTLLMVRFFSNHLRPVVETVAVSEATNFISVTVAEVVEQCMQEQGLGYDDLMEIHQAQEGGITTVTGQTAAINQLKSQIVHTLVSIDSVGDVVAEVRNQFDSAGINQTHHQVLMDLSVTVHLFIPGEITSVTVDTTVCLAETILIGTVPNSYLQTGSIP